MGGITDLRLDRNAQNCFSRCGRTIRAACDDGEALRRLLLSRPRAVTRPAIPPAGCHAKTKGAWHPAEAPSGSIRRRWQATEVLLGDDLGQTVPAPTCSARHAARVGKTNGPRRCSSQARERRSTESSAPRSVSSSQPSSSTVQGHGDSSMSSPRTHLSRSSALTLSSNGSASDIRWVGIEANSFGVTPPGQFALSPGANQ
jgi:hypothetical protein